MEEVQWAVSGREITLNKLVEQEKALEQSFLESVGENNKFKDFLLKVFRKKIKRAKRKQEEVTKEGEGEGEDEEGSEEESDSDYLRYGCCCEIDTKLTYVYSMLRRNAEMVYCEI